VTIKDLTFAELRKANVERCESTFHPLDDWAPVEWLMCVTGELGEVAGELKKLRRIDADAIEYASEEQRRTIGRELADVQTYLDLLAARLHIDLGEAVREKFNIVSDRVGSKVKL
jgi:NTP pyrophosphatase (non-canonical NTP hydrolase)